VTEDAEPGWSVKRSTAVFTIAQDEPDFLPVWLGYYSQYFDPTDIFVLDHDSTSVAWTDAHPVVNRVPVHRSHSFDHTWLRETVQRFFAFLLQSYRFVLFAEADEIVAADPRAHAGGLAGYLRSLAPGDTPRCSGYNLMAGGPVDWAETLLPQCRYWYPADMYSKHLLASTPLEWNNGFHLESARAEQVPDPTLLLLHLHRLDYDRCLQRHRATAARNWSQIDVDQGLGYQNRIAEPAEFEQWYYHDEQLGGPRTDLPAWVREIPL
jgi:hypothetical protein